jgi:hypothetical protein
MQDSQSPETSQDVETNVDNALNPNFAYAVNEPEHESVSPEQMEQYGIDKDGNSVDGLPSEQSSEQSEKILGKFNSQEDLEKAYLELQSKNSREQNNQSNDEIPNTTTEQPDVPTDEPEATVPDVPSDAQAKGNRAFEALKEQGELTPEIQSQFEEMGISPDVINHYQELVQFRTKALHTEIVDSVGGGEAFGAMLGWAKDTMTEAEITSFDKVMDTGVISDMKYAIKNLQLRHDAATKKQGTNLVQADSIGTSQTGYASQHEMNQDIQDPRYNTNPAFRDKVMQKLGRSNF